MINLSAVEDIIRTEYKTCPRPYFIAENNNIYVFTFDLQRYPEFTNSFIRGNKIIDGVFKVYAENEADLAYCIWCMAVAHQLDF